LIPPRNLYPHKFFPRIIEEARLNLGSTMVISCKPILFQILQITSAHGVEDTTGPIASYRHARELAVN
jgi:hypothetical protein